VLWEVVGKLLRGVQHVGYAMLKQSRCVLGVITATKKNIVGNCGLIEWSASV